MRDRLYERIDEEPGPKEELCEAALQVRTTAACETSQSSAASSEASSCAEPERVRVYVQV